MFQPFTFTSHTSVDPPRSRIRSFTSCQPHSGGLSDAAKRRGNFNLNLCRRLDFIPKFWMPLHFDAPFRPVSCFGILARDAISRHHTSPWPVSWYHHEKSSPPATTLCFTISLRQRWWKKLHRNRFNTTRPCLHLDVVALVLLTIKAQSVSSRMRIFKTNLPSFRGQHSNLQRRFARWHDGICATAGGTIWMITGSNPTPFFILILHAWGTPCCSLATGRRPVSPASWRGQEKWDPWGKWPLENEPVFQQPEMFTLKNQENPSQPKTLGSMLVFRGGIQYQCHLEAWFREDLRLGDCTLIVLISFWLIRV